MNYSPSSLSMTFCVPAPGTILSAEESLSVPATGSCHTIRGLSMLGLLPFWQPNWLSNINIRINLLLGEDNVWTKSFGKLTAFHRLPLYHTLMFDFVCGCFHFFLDFHFCWFNIWWASHLNLMLFVVFSQCSSAALLLLMSDLQPVYALSACSFQ